MMSHPNKVMNNRNVSLATFDFPSILVEYRGQLKRFVLPDTNETLCSIIRDAFSVPQHWNIMLSLGLEDDDVVENNREMLLPIDTRFLKSEYIYELQVSAVAPVPAIVHDPTSVQAQTSMAVNATSGMMGAPSVVMDGSGGVHHDHTAAATVENNDEDAVPVLSTKSKSTNVVQALYDYAGRSSVEISFRAGDQIRVVAKYSDAWWKGEVVGAEHEGSGYFPSTYVYGSLSSEFETDGDPMQDNEYFESYNTLFIHHQMLSDDARTKSYRDAVYNLRSKVEGKLVMDIGCGSGILSALCAKAGAKHVYAVDASDIIKMAAARVIKENGLGDVVTLIQGKVEEIVLPNNVKKVDVIISEWMGTFLVCESMIGSVLRARTVWLADDGIMMPSDSTLYLCPVCIDKYYDNHVEFWNDVYGVTMKCLIPQAKKTFFNKPVYDRLIEPDELISDPVGVWNINLMRAVENDLESQVAQFDFVINRDGNFHGFGAWFDVVFGADGCESIILSTSPHHEGTHWKHVLFILPERLSVKAGDHVTGSIVISRNQFWRRHFQSHVEFVLSSMPDVTHKHFFEMWR